MVEAKENFWVKNLFKHREDFFERNLVAKRVEGERDFALRVNKSDSARFGELNAAPNFENEAFLTSVKDPIQVSSKNYPRPLPELNILKQSFGKKIFENIENNLKGIPVRTSLCFL